MYIPNHFKNENLDAVKAFLQKNSFAILINNVDGRPWGTHTPLKLATDEAGQDVLYGHISKANPQWKYFNDADEVLAIFNGPHAFVSASWYNHHNISTWNYVAVHVYGRLEVMDEAATRNFLSHLLDKYEAHSEHPIRMEDLSPKHQREVRGVVGFKMIINEIQAAYKLSQNRDEESHANIIQELRKRGENELADLMMKPLST